MAASSSSSSSSSSSLLHLLFCFSALLLQCSLSRGISLESVRDFLTREEDAIVFSLIERARYPRNSPLYNPSYSKVGKWFGNGCSLVELFVRESERVQAKAKQALDLAHDIIDIAQFGRYQNPEEVPFFPEDLTWPLVPPYNFSKVLYPAAASVNVSDIIWSVYFKELLPQFFAVGGVDGNFASTGASDLACLQALSRRIHYGRFVAEVKFRVSPQDYIPAIRAKDRDALMKLVTSESQEEIVKKRVEKKAAVFGQNVMLDQPVDTGDSNDSRAAYKVDPSVVYRLYGDWVIPLTKMVEIEYLLRRLD